MCLPSLLRIPTQFLLLGFLQIVTALLLKHPPFRQLYYHTSGKVAVHHNHFDRTCIAFRSLWQYMHVLVWAVSTYVYFQQVFHFGDFVLKFFEWEPLTRAACILMMSVMCLAPRLPGRIGRSDVHTRKYCVNRNVPEGHKALFLQHILVFVYSPT